MASPSGQGFKSVGTARRIRASDIWVLLFAAPIILISFAAVLFGEMSWYWKVVFLVVVPFVPLAVFRLNRVPIWLAFRGNYDLALLLNRVFFWAPEYGDSHEGWLLLEAGRYAEAREFYKPLAFDESGSARLTSSNLLFYITSLSRDGKNAAAQELYEAAVRLPQETWNFHNGLAECLLKQRKEQDRARELIQEVLAATPEDLSSCRLRATRAQAIATYGYALASCGRREEAEAVLAESFAISYGIGKRALAGLHHLAGASWQALGDRNKARAAWLRTLELHPFGDTALQVRKKLTELGGP